MPLLADKLLDLLTKQKLVDQMVKNQHASRQDVVEFLLHKQHDVELQNALKGLSAIEIAQVLDELPDDAALALWHKLSPELTNDVLWELPPERRETLAPGRVPDISATKVGVYVLEDGRLQPVTVACRQDLDGVSPIWVDLVNASKAEMALIGEHFQVTLSAPLDATELEVSARFHIDEQDEIHLHSNFLRDRTGDSPSVAVAFILHQGILFSVRSEELPVFRLQKRLAKSQPNYVNDAVDVLLDLYGADVEGSADTLENIYATLGKIGRTVLNGAISDQQAAHILAQIGDEEDVNGRIRSNILDTQRALNFLIRGRLLSLTQLEDARQILRNIESLNSHTSFLFDKINFLMDATIGAININQNKRVSQLTVLSVVFMPVNILAGMGGMSEFSMMTQGIPWPVAYGAFAVGSALIGVMTYLSLTYFEKRRVAQAQRQMGA
ncbi:MAG TPA: CorA family divalent cation transporter [Burkholderiaceae bacterium]|nr:CorA family divalent cation transporter [Burkholderiaceae bacterium]